jgi:hypothetical protein
LPSSVDLRQLHSTLGFGGDTRTVAGGDRQSRRRDDIEFSIPNPCVGGLRDDQGGPYGGALLLAAAIVVSRLVICSASSRGGRLLPPR